MNIMYYILLPIIAYIVDIALGGIIPIATAPLTWIIAKAQKQPKLYQLRIDMIIQGIIRGIIGVYIISLLIALVEANISIWWILLIYIWLSYLGIKAWNNTNPFAYEFSLNISPTIGYIVGFVIFIDLFIKP